ncbi:hypothetical protein MMC13_004201 [Lambiella insularis]|nr:hypothetical protein [Lambiella insularis]
MEASPELSPQAEGSMSSLVESILNDCLYNIVSDTVLKVHRHEKIARMQSAAVVAQEAQEKALEEDPSFGEAYQSITTSGATVTQEGKIKLHGNPFKTTPEVLCPVCRLPRLLYPTTGKNAQTPEAGKEYCAKQPYIEKTGCDIYGKSLTLEMPPKNKKVVKEKDSKAKQENVENSESPEGVPANGKASDKPEASITPTGKCPNCIRYFAFTRIAAHLDGCMGLSGRQARKNAMAKMSSGTPRESRATTPKPPINNNAKKRKVEQGSDDQEGEDTPKKKKKAGDAGPKSKPLNSNIQRVKGAEKRLPGQADRESRASSPLAKSKEKDVKENGTSGKLSKGKEASEKPKKNHIKKEKSGSPGDKSSPEGRD